MSIAERFSKQMRDSLRKKYGRLPSAAFVSVHLSRQTSGLGQVSNETVRRWIRGKSLPKQFHFEAITAWLGLDANVIVAGIHQPKSRAVDYDPFRHPTEVIRLAESINRLAPGTQKKILDLISLLSAD